MRYFIIRRFTFEGQHFIYALNLYAKVFQLLGY